MDSYLLKDFFAKVLPMCVYDVSRYYHSIMNDFALIYKAKMPDLL